MGFYSYLTKVVKDVLNVSNTSTLEIDTETLNQLMYEQTKSYDIIEPFIELYSHSNFRNQINKAYQDIAKINESKR